MAESASSIKVIQAADPLITGVGKYRYIAMLAEGGMADVYLAVTQNAGFEKLVVIKQLRHSLAVDPSFVTMFMDEARLAARLNHPNVVQTLEVGTDLPTGLHFIAMEFLEGIAHVRFARLKDRVPPPLAYHVRVLIDVLRGLHYAHELRDFDGKPLNVVHRDVSPQNVMLTFAGGVKILDFGIAKAALAAEVRPEDFKGKLEYMAPEQARRESVDRRADLFSVGVMLYEALTRRRLFRKGEDKFTLLTEGRLPNVLEDAPATPKRLAVICAKAMAPEPDLRYATAEAMADDLEEWLASTTQHVTAREVGNFVAEKFASTRTKINAAIEAQLTLFRTLQDAAPDTTPDTLPLSRLPFTDVPPADLSDPSAGYLLPPVAPPPAWGTGEGPAAVLQPPPPSPPPPARSSPVVLVLIGALAGIAIVGSALAIATRTRGPASPVVVVESAAAPAATLGVAPPAAGMPEEIKIVIRTTPADASILVDGEPMPTNSTKRRRDALQHLIRIEASGYDTREESVTFEQSLLLVVELHPTATATAAAASAEPSIHHSRPRPKPRPKPADSAVPPTDPYNPQ